MGKSPGKWLKTLLFGNKSLRSSSTKRKDSLKSSNEKGLNNNKGKEVLISENSPIISEPVLVNTYNSSILPSIEDSKSSNLDSIKPENINPINENSIDELRENEAAAKAQAAFRGFLARRAFRALKGIIRLQGLVRGFLVRRQAVATFYAMNGIIKLQALERGRITRRSDLNVQIDYSKIYPQNENLMGCKSGNEWKANFSKNSLGYKLLTSEISSKPLKLQYEETNPNSVLNWLKRWEKTQFWKPISKPKISIKSESKPKESNSPNQTQNLKSKKRIFKTNPEKEKSTKTTPNSESEKPKTNPRRFSLSPSSLSSTQENPKTKPQNPKKPLKKTSNSMSEADFNKTETKESPLITSKTVREKSVSPSEISLSSTNGDSISKPHKRRSSLSSSVNKSSANNNMLASKTVQPEENLSANGDSSTKFHRRRSPISSALKTVPSEENLSSKPHSRRSSFSNGLEIQETESQPGSLKSVPSYMAATQSAKARVKGGGISIPGYEEGGVGVLRRHSLSSLGGKVKPDSPRNRNLGFRGMVKGERSVTMSREGSEKLIQVEWKR